MSHPGNLTTGLFGALLAAGFWPAPAQQPPYLYFTVTTKEGKQLRAGRDPILVPNNERIRLEICLQARTVEEDFEQLEIQALNQHPDYFKNRPGPNVTLKVRRLDGEAATEMPFRVNSSGLGKNMTVHYVNADIDILEDKTQRLEKARLFTEWLAAEVKKQTPSGASHVLASARSADLMIPMFEQQYINNPPGDYEVVARYAPTPAARYWRSPLAARLRITVIQSGDAFETMKTQMMRRR